MPSEPADPSIFSHQGGLRDLATFSQAEIDALPQAQRALFLDLREKQRKCAEIEMQRREVSNEIREVELRITDLQVAKAKQFPPITAMQAHRASIAAYNRDH